MVESEIFTMVFRTALTSVSRCGVNSDFMATLNHYVQLSHIC